MKFEFLNTESLSNNELLEIFGGQNPDKPHGIFQWIGYGIGAAVDAFSAFHEAGSSAVSTYRESGGK